MDNEPGSKLQQSGLSKVKDAFYKRFKEPKINQEQYGLLAEAIEKRTGELLKNAQFDSLTELPNRAQFFSEVERSLYKAEREAYPEGNGGVEDLKGVLVLFVDLDGFKQVNDNLGHAGGDRVLCKASRVMKDTFRRNDLVARISGDEFGVLMEEVELQRMMLKLFGKEEGIQRLEDLGIEPDKEIFDTDSGEIPLRDEMEQELNSLRILEESSIKVGMSMGVAFVSNEEAKSTTNKEIISDADEDMYRDKERRKVER